jgi:ketosteroid isomerase-like protein
MSDSETIARRRAEFVAAFNREDTTVMSDVLSDDHIGMPPNRSALHGIDESRAFWREGFNAAESRFSVFPEKLEISGDIAIDRFRWGVDSAPRSGGEPIHDEGKNIWIWRRQSDSGWKLAQAIWNSDRPQAGLWSGAGTESSSRSALTAKDRETLRTLIEDAWTASCLARDWDKTIAMCAEDIVYMPADLPALRGHAELRSWLDQFPRMLKFTQPLEELEGDANLAVARATFSGAIEAEGHEVAFAGKVLCSFRKEPAGQWLVRRVCWNWDRPMPAMI